MIPFFTDRGISAEFAVIVVAVWSGSGAIGSLIFGGAAEKFSMRWTLTIGFLLNAIGYALLLGVYSEWIAIVWGFYLGVIGGGLFTLQQVVFADYYGRESLGAIRGVVWPIQMLTNALGPLVAAIAYDITGDYVAVFGSFGILIVFASISVFGAKPPINIRSPQN
jgi:MFS family permease